MSLSNVFFDRSASRAVCELCDVMTQLRGETCGAYVNPQDELVFTSESLLLARDVAPERILFISDRMPDETD